ncbi:Unknown protein [Striga hermonthica]|uniref:KIB1-4 beta-propeller domain-containing protein n=1 Tax=Striga hermonthica TaxID=68872 RepID=A0A9N7MNC3_STRHE|nr:Unknown protein [Striga hermonthica]
MAEDHEKLPLLITTHGAHLHRQSLYSLVDRRCKTTEIPIMHCKRILGSSHGWLVLVSLITGNSFLWNPISMREIDLPCLHRPSDYNRCVLTGPPTEPNCHVIFCSTDYEERTVFRVGDGTTVCLPPGEAGGGVVLVALASFRGETYGVVDTDDGEYEFVTVHVVDGGVEFRPLLDEFGQTLEVPISRRMNVKWQESHLIEAPGGRGLLLVMKFFKGSILADSVEFKVFRLEVADGPVECVELNSVDEWTIFINYFGRGFCRISSSERRVTRPNSIYYTDKIGRAVKIYDLGERSTTVLMPFRYAGRCLSVCYWVDIPDIPELEPEPEIEPELEP